GIAGAVDFLVNEFNARGQAVQFTNGMHSRRLSADLESAGFRIVQEALSNVERHSQAKRAEGFISEDAEMLRVEGRDYGVGFGTKQTDRGHFGLEAIQQRAKLVGGRARITSAPGEGTEVLVELPLGEPVDIPDVSMR